MAYERSSDSKIKGDGLDSFIENLSNSLSKQVAIRNAADESKFNIAILEQNLTLDDQLSYRKEQLKRVSDDPQERKRIREEIAGLNDRIEQKKFGDGYLEKLIGLSSGVTSIDSVIGWLNDQKASATDQTIIDTINKSMVDAQQKKYDLTKTMLTNQSQYALNDKSISVLDSQISKVTAARNSALLSGDDTLASNYNLQIQALSKAKTETQIQRDIQDMAVSTVTGYASAVSLLDAYNSKISNSGNSGSITVGDTTYASAKDFWSNKRDSYLADSSNSGFFARLNDEINTQIKVMNSKNTLDTAALQNLTKKYDQLTGRSELSGFENKIDIARQDSLQTGASLISDRVVNKYALDYDLGAAITQVNNLKTLGVNVDDAFTKIITAGSKVKSDQVSGILAAAQNAMKTNPGLTPEQAISLAVKSGAGVVLSPNELANKSEKDLTLGLATGAQNETFGVDPRTTIPGATPTGVPGTTPSGTKPVTNGSIVDYLASIGQASDFNSRAKLAAQSGIANYTGTAAQNTQLLNIVSTSKAPAPTVPTPTPSQQSSTPTYTAPKVNTSTSTPAQAPAPKANTPAPVAQPAKPAVYQGGSIVDYLSSTGKAADYNSRAKLAASAGITNYTGTASQNTQLLKNLRGF